MKALRAAVALMIALGALAALPQSAVAATGDIRVAIAVPITVPVQSTGLIPAESLEQYTAPLGVLTRQLDAVAGRAVTLAVDPLIIVSIRVLGSQAPATARDWLDRLAGVSNDMVPLPFSDSDLTLATQAGAATPLAAPPLDTAIDPTRFAEPTDETPTPTPGATATPEVPPLPTSDDLFAWDWAVDALAWPRENSVVAADLTAIAAGGAQTVVLSSGNVDRGSASGAISTVGELTAIIADDAVSAALRTAASAPNAETGVTSNAALVAAILSAAESQSGTATVVALMDRRLPSNAPRLGEAIDALAATSGLAMVGLSAVLDSPAAPAELIDRPQAPDVVATVTALLDAEAAETRFATITAEPARLTSERRLLLLSLLSQGWGMPSVSWTAATGAFLDQSLDIRNAVQVVEASGFNLLADSAALPIAVSNDLNQAVTVYITVRPDTGILAVGDSRVELVIEPNSQGRGEIPVQAISNGSVTVEISLTGANGVSIGRTTAAEINVQAGWETPIVVVLAAIVVLVFGVGIARNILRRRRAPEEPAEAQEPADG